MSKKILFQIIIAIAMYFLVSCAANSYSVTINLQDGSDPIIEVIESNLPQEYNSLIREGYSFLGWSYSSDGSNVFQDFTPTEDVTIYAVWEINQYSITFEGTEDNAFSSITLNYGAQVNLENPNREGYLFQGWYTSNDFDEVFVLTSMPANDITLYAKWEEIDYESLDIYLTDLLESTINADVDLPTQLNEFNIIWSSNNEEVLSNKGIYDRPYQQTTVELTATATIENQSKSFTYNVTVDGYKSLAGPIASSYIYTNYSMVNDSFFDTLDIINCAFIIADDYGNFENTNALSHMRTHILDDAKQNGNWVLISIAPESQWSEITSTTVRMNNFVDNIIDIINEYDLDGVDIDWETPTYSEATRFTELMEIVYTKVKNNNPNHLVTAAIAGGMWQPPRYDLENSIQYIDYVNMMTYGMTGSNGYYQNALFASSSYADSTNEAGKTLSSCSIEESVQIYNDLGVPNNKIIVGVAFYGMIQTRTYNASTNTYSSWVQDGWASYTSIKNNYLTDDTFNYRYDNNAGVPYLINNQGTIFISYDNPKSVKEKADFIVENGLAGMMYWQNGLDTTGALLSAMNDLKK